ncbi:collagen alpha-1(I) chain-like isoform X2 [Meles meles]|uniref:collagen alpha-1(I) chain-like isoform X2 n=1 Tax=Meles meles TaxID=9662 RepID=UPI001E69B71D|nr:collagen alpha-1(I) chain-like isoform X2 [Meles meles]
MGGTKKRRKKRGQFHVKEPHVCARLPGAGRAARRLPRSTGGPPGQGRRGRPGAPGKGCWDWWCWPRSSAVAGGTQTADCRAARGAGGRCHPRNAAGAATVGDVAGPGRLQDESARGRCYPGNAAAGTVGPGSFRRTSPSGVTATRGKRLARPHQGDASGHESSPRTSPSGFAITRGKRQAQRHPGDAAGPGSPAGRVRQGSLSPGERGGGGGGSGSFRRTGPSGIAVTRGTRQARRHAGDAERPRSSAGRALWGSLSPAERGGGGDGSRVVPRTSPSGVAATGGTRQARRHAGDAAGCGSPRRTSPLEVAVARAIAGQREIHVGEFKDGHGLRLTATKGSPSWAPEHQDQ